MRSASVTDWKAGAESARITPRRASGVREEGHGALDEVAEPGIGPDELRHDSAHNDRAAATSTR